MNIPTYQLHNASTSPSPFSVARLICIGRNYADHAKEMGHDPNREPPFFFFKPLSALNLTGKMPLPHYSQNVHYELELVLALRSGGKNLTQEQAQDAIGGFALGLDMTCRDIQQQAKQQGRPWELAKGFDLSAPISQLALGNFNDIEQFGEMTLTNNATEVQRGNWRDMIWQPLELLQQVSNFIALQPGDLIFTGTPAGVGPVQVGDQLIAKMSGMAATLELSVVD